MADAAFVYPGGTSEFWSISLEHFRYCSLTVSSVFSRANANVFMSNWCFRNHLLYDTVILVLRIFARPTCTVAVKPRVQCIFKRERPGPLSGLFIILNIQWCAVCPRFKSHVTPALPHRWVRFYLKFIVNPSLSAFSIYQWKHFVYLAPVWHETLYISSIKINRPVQN